MTDLRCALRHRDGTARHVDVTVPLEPSAWSADDAKEFLWSVIRLLEAPAVYRVSLVEAEFAKLWRIEVQAATGVVVTPAMPLSSMAYVWLSETAFRMPQGKEAN